MNPHRTGRAVLLRDVQVGISRKRTLPSGTVVDVEWKDNPDQTTSYVLHHKNFHGAIAEDAFRWAEHQQRQLFAESE